MRRICKTTCMYFVLLLVFSGANFFVVGAVLDSGSTIYPGVRIGSETIVGGLTLARARQVIHDTQQTQQHVPLQIINGSQQWYLNPQDIDLTIDELRTAEAAFAVPRQGNKLERFLALHKIYDIDPVISINETKLISILTEYARQTDKEAVAASVSMAPDGQIQKRSSSFGSRIDIVNSMQAIQKALLSGQDSVSLILTEVPPSVSDNDIRDINGIVAEYKTDYNPEAAARTHNIILAAKPLQGILLRPGDVLSFNSIVGPRTEEKGYQQAPAYVNEELSQDWGGGVCQISSTLYNAALLADLAILERTPHYRPAGYVPIGLDATVDFDSNLDLKIKNTRSAAIYITTDTNNNQLIVRIFGTLEPDLPAVKLVTTELTRIEPETTIIQDLNLAMGTQVVSQDGQTGFKVTIERVHYLGDRELQREKIADDTYKPVTRVVRIGAKAVGSIK